MPILITIQTTSLLYQIAAIASFIEFSMFSARKGGKIFLVSSSDP